LNRPAQGVCVDALGGADRWNLAKGFEGRCTANYIPYQEWGKGRWRIFTPARIAPPRHGVWGRNLAGD
jgi:hypothetical protein